MPDNAPFITGSELVSNPGNAALGYSSGVQYNANPAIENPYAVTQNALNGLLQEDQYNRQQKAAQARQDQQELGEYLAGSGQSAFNMTDENGKNMSFNMLPQDRDQINEKATDLRRKIVNNPQTYKFDPEIRKQIDEFNQLKHHASMRAVDYAQKQQMLAQTQNPEERQAIAENIASEINGKKVDDFHLPNPYVPGPAYRLSNLISEDVRTGKNKEAWKTYNVNTRTQNGDIVSEEQEGIADNALDYRSSALRSSDKYSDALNLASSFYNSPSMNDPHRIMAMNENIDRINTQRGYAPDSEHFIPHIAEVLPNGSIQPNKISPVDAAYAITSEAHGGLQKSQTLKKSALDVKKENADINKTYADIQNEKDKLALERDKMSKADYDNKNEELEAQTQAANVYKNLTGATNYKNIDAVIQSVPKGDQSGVAATLKNAGINNADYEIASLNSSDQTIKHIAGVQARQQDGTPIAGVAKPEFAYLLKPKSGDVGGYKYLVGYKTLQEAKGADGVVEINETTKKPVIKEVMQWKTISPQEAIGNTIKSQKNFYNITDKTGDNINKAIDFFGKVSGAKPNDIVTQSANPEPTTVFADGDRRIDNGKKQVYTGGEWKTVKGRDKKGGYVFE